MHQIEIDIRSEALQGQVEPVAKGIIGLFVGAVVMEIIHKKCPEQLDKFYSKTSELATGMKEGFTEGYRSVAKSATPVEA